MKFPLLFLYKSKLLTDLAQIFIGVFYIVLVHILEKTNIKNVFIKELLIINHRVGSRQLYLKNGSRLAIM